MKTTGVPSTWRQLRERGFDFIWKVTLEQWFRKRGSAQGEEQGLEGRGPVGWGHLVGRREEFLPMWQPCLGQVLTQTIPDR